MRMVVSVVGVAVAETVVGVAGAGVLGVEVAVAGTSVAVAGTDVAVAGVVVAAVVAYDRSSFPNSYSDMSHAPQAVP